MSFGIFTYYCDCLEELHTKEEKETGMCAKCKIELEKLALLRYL